MNDEGSSESDDSIEWAPAEVPIFDEDSSSELEDSELPWRGLETSQSLSELNLAFVAALGELSWSDPGLLALTRQLYWQRRRELEDPKDATPEVNKA